MEDVDQQRVAEQVDQVHQEGDQHRLPALAHRAQKSRAAAVDRQRKDRHAGDDEIGVRALHDVRLDCAEHMAHDRPAQPDQDHDKNCGEKR